jgi:GT2 family glycosyltransferase
MDHTDQTRLRPEVSVVIVHYETPMALIECLGALRVSVGFSGLEVFVVDNASQAFDASACERALPGVTVIQNSQNVGFASASNQGLRSATGRYLLLLNPDAQVEPDALETIVRYMDAHPDVGCATARLVLPDGTLDLACRRSFPTPIRAFYRLTLLSRLFPGSRRFGQYNLTYLDEHREADIDAPCGAFMMVRAEIRDTVGLLDERYFMYGEDLDWAFRMKEAGWRVRYVPAAAVHHTKRASSRSWRPRTVRAFHDAMRIFYREHYESGYPRWVSALTYRAIDLREGIELASTRIRRGAQP